jgi:predicted site-specific integrase-resolvase
MTPDTTSPERVAYTPAEFAEAIGTNVKAVRQYINTGQLKAVRLGNRLYIPVSEKDRLFGEAA